MATKLPLKHRKHYNRCPVWYICALLLCVEALSKPCTLIIVLMIALPDRRQSCECCGVVLWSYFTGNFTSFSQWIVTPMCAVIYELRYKCWEQFLSGGWHPPTDCHYLSMCMCVFLCYTCAWAWQKWEQDCCKGLSKPICLFQSVWGWVIVFLYTCVRPVSYQV